MLGVVQLLILLFPENEAMVIAKREKYNSNENPLALNVSIVYPTRP